MLNFKQTIVVNSNKSLITIAGPGSGKTHTITEKIKKEVSQGEDINKYLLLTFTNSAANEIFERVEKKIDKNQIKKPFFGTYHAIFKRLLNSFEQFEKIGLRKNPTIILPNESSRIFNKILKENLIENFEPELLMVVKNHFIKNDKDPEKVKINNFSNTLLNKYVVDTKKILNVIDNTINKIDSEIINSNSTIEEINKLLIKQIHSQIKSTDKLFPSRIINSRELYDVVFVTLNEYFELKRKQNIITFSDILIITLTSLINYPCFQEQVQNNFKHIYVDEFQDTNIIQLNILDKIYKGSKHKIQIIGDPYQSIYSFLGAEIKNIINAKKIFNLEMISLDTNYRSTSAIVDYTNEQLNFMKEKISNQGACKAHNKEKCEPVYIHTNCNPQADNPIYGRQRYSYQRDLIKKEMKKALQNGKTVGLINRSGSDFKTEKMLVDSNIEYEKKGGLNFKETKEIQTLSNLILYIMSEVKKYVSFEIILENTKGIGEKALENYIKERKVTKKLKEIVDLIEGIKKENNIKNKINRTFDFFMEYIYTKISSTWKEEREELAQDRIDLIRGEVEKKETEEEILEEISNLTLDNKVKSNDKKDVVLTTIHSAKGLEWDVVFLIDWSQESFKKDEVEESKRLNYVAISRAKEVLHILNDKSDVFMVGANIGNNNQNIKIIDHK